MVRRSLRTCSGGGVKLYTAQLWEVQCRSGASHLKVPSRFSEFSLLVNGSSVPALPQDPELGFGQPLPPLFLTELQSAGLSHWVVVLP